MTKVGAVVDLFDAANAALTYVGPATRTGGRLSLPVQAAATNPGTGQPIPTSRVSSTALLDLTDSSVVVELVSIPTSKRSQVTINLANETAAAEFVSWSVTAGKLSAIRYVGQQQTVGYSATYSPELHRWLKIRSERGAIVWSSSVDGREWTDRAVLVIPFPITAMRLNLLTLLVELANPSDDDGVTPAPALLDNLNAPPAPLGGDPLTTIAGDGNAPNLAIDVLPTVGALGTFTLDRSRLDGLDLLGWGGGAAWVNIVCDVTTAQIVRGTVGATGPLDQPQAGTCSLVITDTERRFDPTVNAAAIHPRTPIRVRAWGGTNPAAPDWSTVLFTGRVNGDGIAVEYQRSGPPIVRLSASDIIGTLARWQSVGYDEPGVGTGDNLLARVLRVLREVGLDEGTVAPGSDPNYTATLGPATLSDAWPAITNAVTAELGRLWATVTNRLSVHARGSELSGPIRGTLSDWHGESVGLPEVHCCYVDPAVRYSPERVVNRAIGARRNAPTDEDPQQVDDATSQARYDVIAVSDTSLELESVGQVGQWARALVLGNTTPRVRVDSVSPYPGTAPAAWPAVAATDIGDRWYFRLHPEQGATVRQMVGVLGIEHDITPEGWSTRWHTTRAPEPGENLSGWFTLNLSKLDGGDLLAPFA